MPPREASPARARASRCSNTMLVVRRASISKTSSGTEFVDVIEREVAVHHLRVPEMV